MPLTLSTSYAFGDVFGTKSSLHRTFRDAKLFYGMFSGLVAAAAAIVLIPGAPLGVITEAVQALAGVLLPSATVFLLLLCNDREVLGPWRNRPWLNVIASTIVAVLVLLSLILMATTVFPDIDVTRFALIGGVDPRSGAARLRCRNAQITAARQIRHRRGGRAPDPPRAVDDAPADAARATALVDRAQGRDAHDAHLPRDLGRSSRRQGRPARWRLGLSVTRTRDSTYRKAPRLRGLPLAGL